MTLNYTTFIVLFFCMYSCSIVAMKRKETREFLSDTKRVKLEWRLPREFHMKRMAAVALLDCSKVIYQSLLDINWSKEKEASKIFDEVMKMIAINATLQENNQSWYLLQEADTLDLPVIVDAYKTKEIKNPFCPPFMLHFSVKFQLKIMCAKKRRETESCQTMVRILSRMHEELKCECNEKIEYLDSYIHQMKYDLARQGFLYPEFE